jgi:hypothetical protein
MIRTPKEVLTATLSVGEPLDEMGIAVIKVDGDLGDFALEINTLAERRLNGDNRWITMVFFVGTLPALQAVPEDLRDVFHPMDMIDGIQDEGLDTRVHRGGLTDPEEVQRILIDNAAAIGKKAPADAYKPFLGMTRLEIQNAMYLSVILTRKDPTNPKNPFDPASVLAYHHRWARVS